MVQHNFSLKKHNTFGLECKAKGYFAIQSANDIELLSAINTDAYSQILVIGGGSNLLFLNDFDGLILHPTEKTIRIIKTKGAEVWVEASAGVVWDDFVEWTINNNLGGVENLSDIPGNVGAAPVQNIGAYGVEAKDTIETVKGIYLDNLVTFELDNESCMFGYRDSIFKQALRAKAMVTSVIFKLSKHPIFNLSYGNVADTIESMGDPSLQNIRKAIQQIRANKLPDYTVYGNAGSFFKNPVVTINVFKLLQSMYPDMPHYAINNALVKIPAAWLIDQCQLKGFSIGGASVHDKQPLVLINKNNASGQDIYNLAQHVIQTVHAKFNIHLSPEVNIIS